MSSTLKKAKKQSLAERAGFRMCWWCGSWMLSPVTKKPLAGVERDHYGNKVTLHKICAVDFDAEAQEDRVTARHPLSARSNRSA